MNAVQDVRSSDRGSGLLGQSAQIDWRDVLVTAGFGNQMRVHLAWATEMTR